MEKTVLVADDDFEITQSLSIRLRQLGLSVMRSPDATHALVGTQRLRPDLIILDVNMPGGSGLAVAEMLATDREFRGTPVVIYTGCSDDMTRDRCKHLGHHYVQKSPHSWNEIKAIVCKVFDIDPDHTQPHATAADRDKPLSTTAAAPQAQTEDQKVAPSKDLGCPDAPTFSRCWSEIRAAACEALDGNTDRTQMNGAVANEVEPPAADVATSDSASVNGNAAPAAQSLALDTGTAETPEPLQTARFLRDPVEHRDHEGRTSAAKHATVLCIDDDPDISKIIKLRLESYGVEVVRAFNGMQGFWAALDSRPDVIICDVSMPDGDGNYIFSRFKSHPLTDHVPVIILTGHANPALRRTLLSLGASAYLHKPLIFDELLQALRSHIDLPEKSPPASGSRSILRAGSK